MFDLKRPCANCPFRIGQGSRFRLGKERLAEIFAAPAFQCHKTVDYSEDAPRAGDRPQQCAGLIAVLHRSAQANQITQIAERLAGFDPAGIDPKGEAYASMADAMRAHAQGIEPQAAGHRKG